MFLLNSRLGLFSAASLASRLPLSRSYGVILPSSLTTILPLALGFSPHLPVSVCGTGSLLNTTSFSRQCTITHFATYFRSLSPRSTIAAVGLCSCVPCNINEFRRLRNLHRMCISYAFRPRLSPRLTLSGRTFLRKP